MKDLEGVVFTLFLSMCIPAIYVQGYTALQYTKPPPANATRQELTQISVTKPPSHGQHKPPGQTDFNGGPEDSSSSDEVSKRCGSNEEYKHCVSGSCSEWKCPYLWNGWPTRCTRDCRQGCFCKHEFFRTRKRRCELGYRCFFESRFYKKNHAE
uniref:TIL domain containing protein n=1 Tax=Rhipicephalus microplus TaxID=6941 RepID=A0A6G5A4Y8_RHIMP